MDERLTQSWLSELRALETFRKQYLLQFPGTPLDREDPDFRKLLEALVFLSVRTRQATLDNLHATWRRLFATYFDSLLQPLPAMGIAQAVVTARMTEAVDLAAGTAVRVVTSDGAVGSFELVGDLRILPITLERSEVLLRSSGFRVALSFRSRFPRTDPPGVLRLHIHYLDDYLAALQFIYNFRAAFQRATCVYDATVDEKIEGSRCAVSFGSLQEPPYSADISNPLAKVQSFLHFPEQELFINVALQPPTKPWTHLTVLFDLSQDWSRDPPLHRDVFQPFAVPIRNTQRQLSQPILCDGTRDAYPIEPLLGDEQFELCRALGVYELAPEGLVPLPPVALSGGRELYEIEDRPALGAGRRTHALLLRLPEALLLPRQFAVEGIWHQPDFAPQASGRLQLILPDRVLSGVDWQAIGTLRPPLAPRLRDDVDGLLRLLGLKMKTTLSLDELRLVFELLGCLAQSRYREILPLVSSLHAEVAPDPALRGMGIRHVYKAKVEPYEPAYEPMVHSFLTQVRELLDAWNHDAAVTLFADTGQSPLRLRP